jgi:hypothetical protein
MKETIRKLAEASGWSIPEERFDEIAAMFEAAMADTQPVREIDLQGALPSNLA